MTPQEFLAAVLPPPGHGYYCLAELSSSRKKHAFVETLKEAADQALLFDKQKYNTYFALASYETNRSREAANARWVKSFFVDIDCGVGHAYPDARAGASALAAFVGASALNGLPSPIVVSSGGGIHAYWPLDEPVSIFAWKLVAERFKKLCKEHGLAIDNTVTADAARVLRMPGTTNWKDPKNPRLCRIMYAGDGVTTLDAFAQAVGAVGEDTVQAAPVQPLMIPGVKPRAADNAVGVKLLQNSAVHFRTLLAQVSAGKGCAQLSYYVDHAQEEGLEPLWRGLLSIAKACDDGYKGAAIISSLHPYDEERMQQKWKEIKGPYPCAKFNTENPGVCGTCPHWGKVTNPLALARETHVDNEPKVIELVAEPTAPDEEASVPTLVNRPPPPMGFAYGKHGGIYEESHDKSDPDARPVMHLVLPYDFFVVDILNQGGEHQVHMVAMRPEGTQAITFPQRSAVTKDDLCKALANSNILAANRGDQRLFNYVRSCIENSSANKAPLKVPSQYGWQPDDAFVYDGKVLSQGSETLTPLPGLDNIVRVTKPAGTIDGWRHVVNTLIKYKLNDILAIMTVGFGSPLMKFTSFDGLTFHVGSSESGTGKSVSLEMAASIWGHPTRYMVGKDTSGVAMQQRLGLLNSLPLICDEITQKNRKDFEWFPGFVFDMTDGKGKERMEGGANKERVNTTYWSTIALVSSNTHIMDYFSSRKHSSQGEIMRLLELQMNKRLETPADLDDALKNYLPRNYGVAGAKFARYIVDNMQTVRDVVRVVEEDLKATMQKTPDERFWIAGVAACLAGGVLAGRNYANIVDLPMRAIKGAFGRMVENARHVALSSKRDADDILNAYTREFYGRFVVVRKMQGGVAATLGDSLQIDESLTRTEVCGRVERGFTKGRTDFFIEEQLLKRFCASMSFGYSDFKAQMSAKYGAYTTKKDMLKSTKGPAMNVNVLKISVPSREDEDAQDQVSVGGHAG